MKSKSIKQFSRTYWQSLVLVVIVFIILTQVYSWGAAVIEMNRVDKLIEQTTGSSQPETIQGKPGSPPGSSSQSKGALPKKVAPPKAVKNIFKKEEANYVLTAIYMDKAVINGQAVEMMGKIGKATLKEIGMWDVTIEVNGSTRKLEMFKGGGAVPSKPVTRRRSPKPKKVKTKPSKSSSSVRDIRDFSMRELKSLPGDEGMRLWKEASQEERDRFVEREKEDNSMGRGRGEK